MTQDELILKLATTTNVNAFKTKHDWICFMENLQTMRAIIAIEPIANKLLRENGSGQEPIFIAEHTPFQINGAILHWENKNGTMMILDGIVKQTPFTVTVHKPKKSRRRKK